MMQMAIGARLGSQRFVLGNGAREQWAHHLRGLDQPRRLRRGTKRGKPRRDLRQERQVIVRRRRALERDAQKLGKARRERGRKHRIAFDDAGIAIGGALARPGRGQ